MTARTPTPHDERDPATDRRVGPDSVGSGAHRSDTGSRRSNIRARRSREVSR